VLKVASDADLNYNSAMAAATVLEMQIRHYRRMTGERRLAISLGGCTSYFGHAEWEQFAPGLKSMGGGWGGVTPPCFFTRC
jgi:hypothetical protein